ncbi:MAG: hypothetical protein ACE1ZG_06950 [Gammaproteobacteria bacterium]
MELWSIGNSPIGNRQGIAVSDTIARTVLDDELEFDLANLI